MPVVNKAEREDVTWRIDEAVEPQVKGPNFGTIMENSYCVLLDSVGGYGRFGETCYVLGIVNYVHVGNISF